MNEIYSPRKVTIIGGDGIMGTFFTERLIDGGHEVKVIEKGDWSLAPSLLRNADMALVCVPINVSHEVIRKAGVHLNSQALLADVTSVKKPYLKAMLESHSGPVVGLHPMFGPGVDSFISQKVVVCEGRQLGAARWFLDFIEADGGELIHCTAEEHDRIMTTVQAIRHFTTIALGIYIHRAGVNIERTLDFASPVYRLEINMVGRIFAQDPSLYIDIIQATPERRSSIIELAETFRQLADLVASGKRGPLIDLFDEAKQDFGNEPERALDESEKVLRYLCTLLDQENE